MLLKTTPLHSKETTMNKDVKKKWLAALRSGKYTKGVSKLHQSRSDNTEIYCCLGVLCELAVDEGIIDPPDKEDYGIYFYQEQSAFLPMEVLKWAGLKNTTQKNLAVLNDNSQTFDPIIRKISKNL